MAKKEQVTMEKIVALAKQRGFVYPGSEIYGGLANTWDYGPLGTEIIRNIKNLWWQHFVTEREDMFGMDGGIINHPKVWEASGHVDSLNDIKIDCKSCKNRFRADHLIEEQLKIDVEGKSAEEIDKIIQESKLVCKICGGKEFSEARLFNLMFKVETNLARSKDEEREFVYLRPETAQNMFIQFKNIANTTRAKLPFGIAQIGKAFRNEITPGNFIFRTIEFEQMEIEYFLKEQDWEVQFEDWFAAMKEWFLKIGLNEKKLRAYEHPEEKRSHYSKRTVDWEYEYPVGWMELSGLAYRTDYDLKQHSKASGTDLVYFDQESGKNITPHIIEPTFGVGRLMLTLMLDAYAEEEVKDVNDKAYTRKVLRLHPQIAPYKVAILPLMKKPDLAGPAKELAQQLRGLFPLDYDETGSIGKRYRRQDEIGTPFCLTIDYDSLEDKSVTVRDRDTMQQERVKIEELPAYLGTKIYI
ncbi:glycine--tRNA ligase [Patescibacteria group bacterium]